MHDEAFLSFVLAQEQTSDMTTPTAPSSGIDATDSSTTLIYRQTAGRPLTEEPDTAVQDGNDGHANHDGRKSGWSAYLGRGGNLRPFRLLRHDLRSLKSRYISDWTLFNQQVVASSVYIFFTNILPGITFASDLYTLTGRSWGTIEIVFSTGLCGIIFAL